MKINTLLNPNPSRFNASEKLIKLDHPSLRLISEMAQTPGFNINSSFALPSNVNSEMGGFVISGDERFDWEIDRTAIVGNRMRMIRHIIANGNINHEFMSTLVVALRKVPRADAESTSSYSPTLNWEATDWPVKQALPGAIVIFGGTEAGKTYFVANTLTIDVLIRFGEPVEEVDLKVNTIMVNTFEEAITYAITLNQLGFRTAVDSTRLLMNALRGPATEGSVAAYLFSVFTNLNNLFVQMGVTVPLTLNPMESGSPGFIQRLYTRVAASVNGIIWLENRSVRLSSYRLSTQRVTTMNSWVPNMASKVTLGDTLQPIHMEAVEITNDTTTLDTSLLQAERASGSDAWEEPQDEDQLDSIRKVSSITLI